MNNSTFCTFCTAEATNVVIDVDGDRSPLCATCTAAFGYALACISPSVVPIENLGKDTDEREEEPKDCKVAQ